MTILEELIRYSEDCISGKIISCDSNRTVIVHME